VSEIFLQNIIKIC